MGVRIGDKYRCTDPRCGCEVAVVTGSASKNNDLDVRCSCGSRMEKGWRRPAWLPSNGLRLRLRLGGN